MSETSSDSGLEESQLGRLDYWEDAYTRELLNFQDIEDEGEIWFGRNVLQTVVEWADTLLQKRCDTHHEQKLLDIGTGNGILLMQLHKLGYRNLTGSDYSQASIGLATAIAAKQNVTGISWVHDDLLESRLPESSYDLILDKGTLDAIGLSKNSQQKREQYRASVWKLLLPGGMLVITSCNSTADELKVEFCNNHKDAAFMYLCKVESYPVYRFGGAEGTRVCTVALQKISPSM